MKTRTVLAVIEVEIELETEEEKKSDFRELAQEWIEVNLWRGATLVGVMDSYRFPR